MDWCCLCKCNGENANRPLLHCGEVSWLWSFASRSFGVAWVLPKRVIDLLATWRNWFGMHTSYLDFGVTLCDVDYLEGEK